MCVSEDPALAKEALGVQGEEEEEGGGEGRRGGMNMEWERLVTVV